MSSQTSQRHPAIQGSKTGASSLISQARWNGCQANAPHEVQMYLLCQGALVPNGRGGKRRAHDCKLKEELLATLLQLLLTLNSPPKAG